MLQLELYFTDEQRQRWRVYDVAFGPPLAAPHKSKVLELMDPRASYRIFVPKEGRKRSYRFRTGESRAITTERLAQQLASAEYPAIERFDPGQIGPR